MNAEAWKVPFDPTGRNMLEMYAENKAYAATQWQEAIPFLDRMRAVGHLHRQAMDFIILESTISGIRYPVAIHLFLAMLNHFKEGLIEGRWGFTRTARYYSLAYEPLGPLPIELQLLDDEDL